MYPKLIFKEEIIERVIQLHVEGMTDPQVARSIKSENPGEYPTLKSRHIKLTRQDPSHTEIVTRRKDAYLSSVMDVPLSQKRIRLDDLNRERVRIIATIQDLCGDAEGADGTIKQGKVPTKDISKYLSLVKKLIEVTIAGRDEVEKKPDLMDMFARSGPLSGKTDEELMAYERKLTIELTAYRAGTKVQGVVNSEVGRFKGVSETP